MVVELKKSFSLDEDGEVRCTCSLRKGEDGLKQSLYIFQGGDGILIELEQLTRINREAILFFQKADKTLLDMETE